MHITGFAEAKVQDTTEDPGEKASSIGETDEAVEDHPSLCTAVEVSQGCEETTGKNSVVGQTPAIASCENLGRIACDSERVERSARHVQVGIARGPSTGENACIDNGGQGMNACILNSNDPRRCVCVAGTSCEAFGLGWAGDADCQCTQDVEDHQSQKEATRSCWEILSWISHFSGSEDHQFGAKIEGESSKDPDVEKSSKSAAGSLNKVGVKGSTILPVAEPKPVMVRCPTEHDDQRQEEHAKDHNDLDSSKPELGFGIDTDWA